MFAPTTSQQCSARRPVAESDRAGRLLINPDLTVGGFANVFAIGDMTSLNGSAGSVARCNAGVAVTAAKTVNGKVKAGTPFKYFDKGSMSIISRFSAVCRVRKVEFKGTIAWFMWAGRARDVSGGLPQPVCRCDVVVRFVHRSPSSALPLRAGADEDRWPRRRVTEREPELAHISALAPHRLNTFRLMSVTLCEWHQASVR